MFIIPNWIQFSVDHLSGSTHDLHTCGSLTLALVRYFPWLDFTPLKMPKSTNKKHSHKHGGSHRCAFSLQTACWGAFTLAHYSWKWDTALTHHHSNCLNYTYMCCSQTAANLPMRTAGWEYKKRRVRGMSSLCFYLADSPMVWNVAQTLIYIKINLMI